MKDIIKLIGNTPIYHMENTNIYIKLEKYNAGGSVKDRAVLNMIQDGIKTGKIKKDSILIEATSGNTGIALAMIGSAYNIPVKIVMPNSMSLERRNIIKAYGAELLLTDGSLGMQGAVDHMNQLLKEDEKLVSLDQFNNIANVHAHYNTTGNEILKQVPNIDIFVNCIGTGGTFTGVSQRLKDYNQGILCIAGEPKASPLLSLGKVGSHKIQGIGANFIPKNLNQNLIDDILLVSDEEAFEEAIAFGKSTGILVGISSGANIALAKKLAKKYPDKTIVTIAPDGGEKYLSVFNYDEVN